MVLADFKAAKALNGHFLSEVEGLRHGMAKGTDASALNSTKAKADRLSISRLLFEIREVTAAKSGRPSRRQGSQRQST
jgi:hypothetical protein